MAEGQEGKGKSDISRTNLHTMFVWCWKGNWASSSSNENDWIISKQGCMRAWSKDGVDYAIATNIRRNLASKRLRRSGKDKLLQLQQVGVEKEPQASPGPRLAHQIRREILQSANLSTAAAALCLRLWVHGRQEQYLQVCVSCWWYSINAAGHAKGRKVPVGIVCDCPCCGTLPFFTRPMTSHNWR
jgi:hypothetical protein